MMAENDPRRKQLRQIAVLEELVKTEKSSLELQKRELEVVRKEEESQERQKRLVEEKLKKQVEEEAALKASITQKEKVLESLAQELESVSPVTVSFTTLTTHDDKSHYFILLRKGKLWRIGPSGTPGPDGNEPPHDDVDSTRVGNTVTCFPKKDRGLPAMNGELLSSDCLRILSEIPSNRGAVFCFSQEDAAVFYKMREQLKKRGIFHGFGIQDGNDSFVYVYSSHVHNEY